MIKGKNVVISASYIVGFTEGEGCFLVVLRKDNRIDLRFFISQAIGNKDLLVLIQHYLKAGSVYQKKSAKNGRLPAYVFEITKRDEIYNIVIPFFKKHKLLGYKAKSFKTFCDIAEIVRGRQDVRKLTIDEYQLIIALKLGMNKHYGLDADKITTAR